MKVPYRFISFVCLVAVGSWAMAQANTAALDLARFMDSFSAKDIEIRFSREALKLKPRDIRELETFQRQCGEQHLSITRFLEGSAKSLAGVESENGKGSAFRVALADYDKALSNAISEAIQMRGHSNKPAPKAPHAKWADVGRVIRSYLQLEEFDPMLISPPTRYNLNAFLQDDSDGAFFADPKSPDQARIWKTFSKEKDALKPGDLIVAVKGEEDEEWKAVKTWHDVIDGLLGDRFFEEQSEVEIKFKRGSKVREKDLRIGKWILPVSKPK